MKRKLTAKKPQGAPKKRGRRTKYTKEDADALLYLREASRFIDARGLKSRLPGLIRKIEKGGHRYFPREVKNHLAEISPRTIDRLVTKYGGARPHSGSARRRRSRRGTYEASLRVRTWAEWRNEPPGSVLADHVHHTGNVGGGPHCYTIDILDVATSWTWLHASERLQKDVVVDMLSRAYKVWPVRIHALHTDRGTEFLNDEVGEWVEQHGIDHTMGRIARSNDQARVEQRNYTAVRLELADHRFAGATACKALNDFYAKYCLYLNYFRPVRKLSWRGPNGERAPTRFQPPATPYELMLASGALDPDAKQRLKQIYEDLDPVVLNDEIDKAQRKAMRYVA